MTELTETVAIGVRFVGRAALSGLLLTLGVVESGAAADATMPAMYYEQVALAHRHALALESAWYRAACRGQATEALTLSLEKAVHNQDLKIRVLRSPLIGVCAQASAPGLNRSVHEMDVLSFDMQGDDAKGTVTAKTDIRLCFDADTLGQQMMAGLREVAGALTLKLTLNNGTVTGDYTMEGVPLPPKEQEKKPTPSPMQTARGKVTGTLAVLSVPPEPDAASWAPRKQDTLEDLYAFGQALERTADRWYQRLRAIEIARRNSVPYTNVLKDIVFPRVSRPTPKFSAEASEDAAGGAVTDDLLEDVGLLKDKTTGTGKAKGKNTAADEIKVGLALVQAIAERTARMLDAAAYLEREKDGPKFVQETAGTEDPEFGPWYGEDCLDYDGKSETMAARNKEMAVVKRTYQILTKEIANRLPDALGGEGPQEWRAVTQWRCIGPFPLSSFEDVVPGLPDMPLLGNETCEAQRTRLGKRIAYTKDDPFGWQPVQVLEDFGYVLPPRWHGSNPYYHNWPPVLGYKEYRDAYSKSGHPGLPECTLYAQCLIESPKDIELLAGLGLNRQGRLWVNDRLVWSGPARPEFGRQQHVALIRLPLRKGRNRLLLRVDADWSSPFWWLRVCTRGTPRPAAEVRAAEEAKTALLRSRKPETVVGFRRDGTGVYPGTRAPVAWNVKQRQNVLWHVPLPYYDNSTPVPVPGTNRLLITMDPWWLICLDKDTGRELWKKHVSVIDFMSEDDRKKVWELHDAWRKARLERDSFPVGRVKGEKWPWPKWLSYQEYWAEGTGIWEEKAGPAVNEREGASPELIALLDKRDELEKSPDPAGVQEELNRVSSQIEKLQAKKFKDDPNSLPAAKERLEKASRSLAGLLRRYCHVGGLGGSDMYWGDYASWMYATPITDGKRIWVKSGTDVAACYDLDGNEIWKTQIWGAGAGDKMHCSPVLAGGKFIVQAMNGDPDPKKPPRGGVKIVAYDALTGKKVWEVRDLPDTNWNDIGPTVLSLSDGREVMQVLVTPEGMILRVDDGKVLVNYYGANCALHPLTVAGDTVVSGAAGLVAVQFIMKSRDQVGFRHLWAQRGDSHGSLNCGGAVAVDGRMFFTVSPGWPSGGDPWGLQEPGTPSLFPDDGACERWKSIVAHDLATGRQVFKTLALRKGGNQYSPSCASDGHVYVIDGDTIFVNSKPKAPMDMVVLTREERPLRLANNAIDRTYGSGALEGDRLYIRGYYSATCVAYTGEEGKRYEAQTVARNLLDDLYAERPSDTAPKPIPMQNELKPRLCAMISGHAPFQWWILGPLPREQTEEAFKAFGGAAKKVQGDEKITVAGVPRQWTKMEQDVLHVPEFKRWELDPANFCDIHRLRRVVDLGKVIRGQKNTVAFLTVEMNSEREQTMRFEQTMPGVRAWLGGAEIAHGDRVKVGKGVCQLLLEITVQDIPAEGLHLSPRFWASEDAKQEAADWRKAVERRRRYFDDVIRLVPDSAEAAAARKLLAELK